jgi:hypothetical protein
VAGNGHPERRADPLPRGGGGRRADCQFPHHAINRVRIHAPGCIERLAIAAQWAEKRPVRLRAMPGVFQIGADALDRRSHGGQPHYF